MGNVNEQKNIESDYKSDYKFDFIVRNFTEHDVKEIKVDDCNSYDFITPLHDVFNKTRIRKYSDTKRLISYNRNSRNCDFTMTLIFSDDTKYAFRIKAKKCSECFTVVGKSTSYYEHDYNAEQKVTMAMRYLEVVPKSHKVTVKVNEKKRVYYYIEKHKESAEENITRKLWERAKEEIKNRKIYANQLLGAERRTELQHAVEQMAHCHFVNGKDLLEQAFDFEEKDYLTQAEIALKEARSKFAEAHTLVNEEGAYSLYHNIVNAKMEGNSYYNEGAALEDKGYNACDLHQYEDARTYLKRALAKYKHAREVFDNYSIEYEKLGKSSSAVSERIDEIYDAIIEIEDLEHNDKMRSLTKQKDDSKNSTNKQDELEKLIRNRIRLKKNSQTALSQDILI